MLLIHQFFYFIFINFFYNPYKNNLFHFLYDRKYQFSLLSGSKNTSTIQAYHTPMLDQTQKTYLWSESSMSIYLHNIHWAFQFYQVFYPFLPAHNSNDLPRSLKVPSINYFLQVWIPLHSPFSNLCSACKRDSRIKQQSQNLRLERHMDPC